MLLLRVFSLLSIALPSVYAQASSDAASELAALSAALPTCGVRQRALILLRTLTDPFLAVVKMLHHRTRDLEMHRRSVRVWRRRAHGGHHYLRKVELYDS